MFLYKTLSMQLLKYMKKKDFYTTLSIVYRYAAKKWICIVITYYKYNKYLNLI